MSRAELAALIVAGIGVAVCAVYAPLARAAEEPSAPPSERTHQLIICQPGQDCAPHGRPSGATACELNLASERLQRVLPSGTALICKRVRS